MELNHRVYLIKLALPRPSFVQSKKNGGTVGIKFHIVFYQFINKGVFPPKKSL